MKKPTRREFDGCCNEFLWVSIYVAKGLWRDQVLYAQAHLNDPVRLEMMKMLDWYIGVNTDFSVTTGKCGKYLREYLDEKSWVKLLKTYPDGKRENIWEAPVHDGRYLPHRGTGGGQSARPIILSDRTGHLVIIAGNQRYEACVQLGIKEVPTVLIPNLTEDREREIIIRDNVSNGEWDMSRLFEWDCRKLIEWGLDGISFPDLDDFPGGMEDTHNVLRNENYEAGAHIKYLAFEGYKIPITDVELEGLKQRAAVIQTKTLSQLDFLLY